MIQILREKEDWWLGLKENGEIGYFPPSYLKR